MEDDDIVVTDAMRRAVNREACMANGHHLDLVFLYTRAEPAAVVCDRCGDRWNVVPSDP